MPTFFVIEGVKIELYYNDHAPPHFHAIFAEYELLIEIKTLIKIKGELPRHKEKKVIAWASQNREVLLELWDSLRLR